MAKSDNAKYAPGELSRVRERLGPVDWKEAKDLAKKLGGEVGYERSKDDNESRQEPQSTSSRHGGRPVRRVELPHESDSEGSHKKKSAKSKGQSPLDDPSVTIKPSFMDRLKMDRFAAQPEFEIKSTAQILHLMFSFFRETPDYVSSTFINRRMPEYYKKIESLVVSTRTLFPRNNARRNEKMKKSSPLSFSVLDVIRYWNIEKISGDIARIQARPKNALVSDFADILRAVYRPLYFLEKMDPDIHIRGAYKVLYKLLYIENPDEARNKCQELIRTALSSYFEIRRDIQYLLYPLLMKSVSSKYVHYNDFFTERRHRINAFLNVTEEDHLDPEALLMHAEVKEEKHEEEDSVEEGDEDQTGEEAKEEAISEEERDRRSAKESEKKALERGFHTLEALFPKAGWDKLDTFPDLYPYFMNTFDLKRGVVNIAPDDAMQQVIVLMRILEELIVGLRSVSFGYITGPGGAQESVEDMLGGVINGWRHSIEISFTNEYLPRMSEYIRILEGSVEERISPYTRKLISELHWIKRLYFLPYYKFESMSPPTLQKRDIDPIYVKIKTLRKYLTAVAAGIEQGKRAGGAASRAACDGINNPWDPYVFQVPNPVSIRLNALLSKNSRNNASLIYFSLAVSVVLDYIVNNENSWAYSSRPGSLFRSVDGDGIAPLYGVDSRIDADALFKESLKNRQKKVEA